MALELTFPFTYVPDFTKGKPVALGDIYVGIRDLDPKTLANQITIQAKQENGSLVPLSQPVKTSAGGVPTLNGSPISIVVNEAVFSIRVDNSQGAQVYYQAQVNGLTVEINNATSVNDIYEINLAALPNGSLVLLSSWHDGWESIGNGMPRGGGTFEYDVDFAKSNHNGGTVLSITVPKPSDQANIEAFLNGDGETDPSGNGCLVRVNFKTSMADDFGAVADSDTVTGTDDGPSAAAAHAYAEDKNINFEFGAGSYFISGKKFKIDSEIDVVGQGRDVSRLYFGGSPSKDVITQIQWQAAFDTGDKSGSADSAVAYAFWLSRSESKMLDISVFTATLYTGYTTPFSYAINGPTTDYDYGVLVTRSKTSNERVKVEGVWNIAALSLSYGIGVDFGDGFSGMDSQYCGFWGLAVLGPEGQPISGDDFQDMDPLDTRCSGGISDSGFVNCEFASTHSNLDTRLTIDGTKKRVRRTNSPAGGLLVNGQLSTVASERIQGVRFENCRFKASDLYTYSINYANRIELIGCHSDPSRGSVATDGVSSIPSSDFRRKITANARAIKFHGGNSSSEDESELVYTNISESAFDAGDGIVRTCFPKNRETGESNPDLIGTSGSVGTYGSRKMVWSVQGGIASVWIRLDVTDPDTLSGSVHIPMPFVADDVGVISFVAMVGTVSNCTVDIQGGTLAQGSDELFFTRFNVSSNFSLLTGTQVLVNFRMGVFIQYPIEGGL